VYEQIKIMISVYVKTMKPEVKSEGQEADVSSLEGVVLKITPEVSGRCRLGKITEVLYDWVFDYGRLIVKVKGGLKGIEVCYEA
jgi:hypothetical protein